VPQIFVLQIVRHHAEVGTQVPDVPALLAEEADVTARALDGIDLARQQLQQGRFAGAVGAEDGGMAAGGDVERQIIEDAGLPAIHSDVADLDDVLHMPCSRLAWDG
jgi:hypothetical protein